MYKRGPPACCKQASKGSFLGLKTPYPMIIFFETKQDYEKFAMVGKDTFEFGHGKKVVALTALAIAGMPIDRYTEGMTVFTPTQLGIIYQPPISGQKYSFTPMGN